MNIVDPDAPKEIFSADSLSQVFDHHGWKVEEIEDSWFEPVVEPKTPRAKRRKRSSKSRGFPLLIGIRYYAR